MTGGTPMTKWSPHVTSIRMISVKISVQKKLFIGPQVLWSPINTWKLDTYNFQQSIAQKRLIPEDLQSSTFVAVEVLPDLSGSPRWLDDHSSWDKWTSFAAAPCYQNLAEPGWDVPFQGGIPSVNLTLGTGKSPCLMGKLTINGHFP